jgi:hypothetical protein
MINEKSPELQQAMNLILVDNRKSPDLCQAFGHILNDN